MKRVILSNEPITNRIIPTLWKSNLLVELILENSLETTIKFKPYLTSKNFIKNFCKDYNLYNQTIL